MPRNDFDEYYTPPELVTTLLTRVDWKASDIIAEPCAGGLDIANELRRNGFKVITGDVQRLEGLDFPGHDFFGARAHKAYRKAQKQVTNPPFSYAAPWIRRALTMTDYVCALLRITFLEPCSKQERASRIDLLDSLSRVIVCPRVSFGKGKSGTDSTTCAWCIWDKENTPERPTLEWIHEWELEEARGQIQLFETT